MSVFFQTGAVAALHGLGATNQPQLERDLQEFAKETPIALVLPCHVREAGTKARKLIARELRNVSYLKQVIDGIDGANARGWKKARYFFAQLPQKPTLLWRLGPLSGSMKYHPEIPEEALLTKRLAKTEKEANSFANE